ncbi:MAG: DUF58 domain-containing protein [Flavipsychrobacter sp.]
MEIKEHRIVENLELLATQAVEGFIIGLHKSPFHGFSVEFAEHRLYNDGDSLKHIDWRIYGKTDKLFVKRYEEETNLRCCLVVDTSTSMRFPKIEGKYSKLEFSAIAAASIMQLLKKQLDAASLALFDEHIHYFSEFRSAQSHYRMLIHQLEAELKKDIEQKKTNAIEAIHNIAEKIHKRSLVILFSDMIDDAENSEQLFEALQHLRYNKHEVILFHVIDGDQELHFDFENRPYEFVDMETGEKLKLQPQQIKEDYIQRVEEFRKTVEEKCLQYRIDYNIVDLTKDVGQVLNAFLLKRNKLL